MGETIVTSGMMKGLRRPTKFRRLQIVSAFLLVALSARTPIAEAQAIKITKEESAKSELRKQALHDLAIKGNIEDNMIVRVNFPAGSFYYLVPVRVNGEDGRGCFLFSYDSQKILRQKVLLSAAEEGERCEVVKEIFSCRRDKGASIVVLYGKRMGFDHYWFEGTVLNLSKAGALVIDTLASDRLTDISTVAEAQRALRCQQ